MSANVTHPFLTEEPPVLLPAMDGTKGRTSLLGDLDWRQGLGGAVLLLGFVVLALGWFGLSGTARTVDQLSYLASGGLGGAALIATGLALLVAHEHACDRKALVNLEERLGARLTLLEHGVAGEFDTLRNSQASRPTEVSLRDGH